MGRAMDIGYLEFRKVFNSVPHKIFTKKLKKKSGIEISVGISVTHINTRREDEPRLFCGA